MNDQVKEQPSPTRERLETSLERHPGILVGAGVVALVACGFLLFRRRARHERERQRDAILAIAARVLGPAYVVEPAAARHGALTNSLKKAGSALVAAVGREVGRRALLAVHTRITELEQAEGRAPA